MFAKLYYNLYFTKWFLIFAKWCPTFAILEVGTLSDHSPFRAIGDPIVIVFNMPGTFDYTSLLSKSQVYKSYIRLFHIILCCLSEEIGLNSLIYPPCYSLHSKPVN